MKKKALILGNSSCAFDIAQQLLNNDIDVVITAKDDNLSNSKVVKIWGAAGDFNSLFTSEKERVNVKSDVIIIAENYVYKPNYDLYGLQKSADILCLTDFGGLTNLKNKKLLFFAGVFDQSSPVLMKHVMESALQAVTEFGCKVYVAANDIKVAGDGLEQLSQKTRKAGVIYTKATQTKPKIYKNSSGKITAEFFDDILQKEFKVEPDFTFVDYSITPEPYLKQIGAVLRLDRDENDFLQKDNVRRFNVYTNVRGIFAAGPARKLMNSEELKADTETACAAVLEFFESKPQNYEQAAVIDEETCARCLTCFRACPHAAIGLVDGIQPFVFAQACEMCGICASLCPAVAIKIKGAGIEERLNQVQKFAADTEKPFIAALCCEKSALKATESALAMGEQIPKGILILKINCGGSIQTRFILEALKNGTDGIIILTCHQGNCHSEKGNILAKDNIGCLKKSLENIGFDNKKVEIRTLSSCMEKEFIQIINGFYQKIKEGQNER